MKLPLVARFFRRDPGAPIGRTLSLATRAFAIFLALAAVFLPPMPLSSKERSVVYVIDRSSSTSDALIDAARAVVYDAYHARGEARIGVVAFDDTPEIAVPMGADVGQVWVTPPDGRRSGTDVASAIRLAASMLPAGGERRIVLLSDGRATRGDALAAVREIAHSGVEVDTIPLDSATAAMPRIDELRVLASEVAEGESVGLEARVEGPPGWVGLVHILRDGTSYAGIDVTIGPDGTAIVSYDDPAPGEGMHVYTAELVSELGASSAQAAALVSGKPTVLVLSSLDEVPLILLDALSKMDVRIERGSLETPPDAGELRNADLVVLADIPLERPGEMSIIAGLSMATQESLLTYVSEHGGGVLVLGGAFGFSPEWAGSPLARMLPVEIEDLGEVDDPEVAMTVMLDRSGSMGAMVGTHSKLELAIEAALASASTLRATDRVGIASVDTETIWHQPLAPAAELIARREAIRAMGLGGGGIYVYTALADAYAALHAAPERVRHVILFSDTADSEEQFLGCPFPPCSARLPSAITLAHTAREAGITTSVVGVGNATDSDAAFLRHLAEAAGGRYYLTSTGSDLRRIFVSETRAATRSNLEEKIAHLSLAASHEVVRGIDVTRIPPVHGYVRTGLRNAAVTALVAEDGRPILAASRYGLGTVTALTTDAGGRWTSEWTGSEDAMQLMRQIVRTTLRRRSATAADVRVTVDDGSAEVMIELGNDGEEAPQLELFTVDAQGVEKPVRATLERVASGRYRARARTYGEPFALARVRDGNGGLVASALGQLDRERELVGTGADRRELATLASQGHGRFDPPALATLRPAAVARDAMTSLAPFAWLAAALLVCLDVWLRRVGRRVAKSVRSAAQPQVPPVKLAA